MSVLRVLPVALLALTLLPAAADARLAFVCDTSEICLASDDGTNPEPITTDGARGGNYRHPTFSKDGSRLAFDSNAGTYLFTPATGTRVLLTGDEASSSTLSPNGALLATSEQRANPDQGFSPVVCVYATAKPGVPVACDSQAQPFAPGLAYGPDNRLYTTISGTSDSICRRSATGTACEATVVTDPAHTLRDLAVSPDGTRVAVNWAPADGRTVRGPIAVYSLQTGALERQLTTGSDYAPTWTPDGKDVVFSRGVSLSDSAIYSISAAGKPGDERRLVPEGREASFGATSGAAGIAGFGARADGHAVAVRLTVAASDSTVRAHLGAGLGKAVVRKHLPAGKRTLTVSLSAKGRKKLKQHGSLKVTLSVTVTPPAGAAATATKPVTLRK